MPKMKLIGEDASSGLGVAFVEGAFTSALFGDYIVRSNKRVVEIENDNWNLTFKGRGFVVEDGEVVKGNARKIEVTSLSSFTEGAGAEITGFGDVRGLMKAAVRAENRGVADGIDDVLHKMKWTFIGTPGNDRLDETTFSGSHDFRKNDSVKFGAGNDAIQPGSGNDKVFAGAGQDFVDGGRGNDKLFGQGGNDQIDGGVGRDRLVGGGGDDRLVGEEGNDRLFGGGGRDELTGGSGDDVMKGGGGADRFLFVGGFTGELTGDDRITDFRVGVDAISLISTSVVGAEEVQGGVLLEHSVGTILIEGGDIDDWGNWQI